MQQFNSLEGLANLKAKLENKKESAESLIPSIKIDSWRSVGYRGGEWESSDGYMAGNDAHEVAFFSAGLEIDTDIFPNEYGRGKTINIESFDPEEIMAIFKERLEKENKKAKQDSYLSSEKIEIILQEFKEKLPEFKKVDNPYIVQTKELEATIGNCWDKYKQLEKRLLGVPYGLVLIKLEEDQRTRETVKEVTKSTLERVVSLEDAKRRNIPVKQYEGSLYAHFPKNQISTDELVSEKIKPFQEDEERFFDADVELYKVENTGVGKNQRAYYVIKNVVIPAFKYKVTENLVNGETEEKYLEKTTVLEDKSTSIDLAGDETPLPSGHYKIELTIPTNGRQRGQRVYSIAVPEQIAEQNEILQSNLEQEASNPYQQELAKSATLMKGLTGSHRDQSGLSIYAVKEQDSLWHAYVGEPFHLQPLKGYKSSSTSSSVDGLSYMLREAGY